MDDVSSLFHLPIVDRLFTSPIINLELTCIVIVRDLRVTKVIVLKEFDDCRGAHFRMSWLRDKYTELMEAQMYGAASRVYMLHPVTCTLLSDKFHVYIDARHPWLFNSLEHKNWAWGCVSLTIIYATLGVTTSFETI